VASTIIGVTSLAQLDENLDAWSVPLSPELLAAVDGSGWTRATRRSDPMGKAKTAHVSETPATAVLRQHGVAFTEHPYDYVEHGGATHSAEVLGFDPFSVVKTLVMQDQDAKPLIVLMHGNRKVSTKNLARQIGAKSVEPCKPEVASRHSGYWWAAPRPSARAVPCRCSSRRASSSCRASPSTAGGAAT
jgi:hypothetical protein